MLRITNTKTQNAVTLRVEGKLSGPWVDELERAWRSASESADGCAWVDLTDVTFVGEDGKRLLEVMYGEGARFKAATCATRRLVEEIGQNFSRLQSKNLVPSPK